MTYESRSKLFLFCTSPFLTSCLFSFCPKEGHFCPMGHNNIDVKRWVIDWEERTAKTVDMQQTTSGTKQQKHSYMYAACAKEYSFHCGVIHIYWILNTCQADIDIYWGPKEDVCAHLPSPRHKSCAACYTSLHVGEIDATLLCSIALRYIWSDNESAFCPDWMGWWHRYEIAPAFPWLLCVFHIDTSSCLAGHLTCISWGWLKHWKISVQQFNHKLHQ